MTSFSLGSTTARPLMSRVLDSWCGASLAMRAGLIGAVATSIVVAANCVDEATARATTAAAGALLVIAALVDCHERRLPNQLLGSALLITIAGPLLAGDLRTLLTQTLGMLVAGLLLVVARISRSPGNGIGMGDVKMGAVAGCSASSVALVAAPTAVAVAAAVGAGYGLLARRRTVVLGPAIWVGWAVALWLADSGWTQSWYLS